MKHIVLFLLKIYKATVSPVLVFLFGRGCKYEISCSEYAMEVVQQKGIVKGLPLATKRFLSCNNFAVKLAK